MSAQTRIDALPGPPVAGAAIHTARATGRVFAREAVALVGVCCTACLRTIPPGAAARDERADWRCRDTAGCRAARARHDDEAARRAATMAEGGRS